jgi:hypothetical protein
MELFINHFFLTFKCISVYIIMIGISPKDHTHQLPLYPRFGVSTDENVYQGLSQEFGNVLVYNSRCI